MQIAWGRGREQDTVILAALGCQGNYRYFGQAKVNFAWRSFAQLPEPTVLIPFSIH